MEDEPIRLTIQKRLTEEIAARANLPGAVFRGRDYYGDQGEPLPMVTLFEVVNEEFEVQTNDGAPSLATMPMLIVGLDDDRGVNPTDNANLLLHRVKQALKGIKRDARGRRGDLVYLGVEQIDRIDVGVGQVLPAYADGFTNLASFRLPISISFIED